VGSASGQALVGARMSAASWMRQKRVNDGPEIPCFSQGVGRPCEIKAAKIGRQEVAVIVHMKMKIDISRTCGSVRSSLSALAGLVTARSEAAETTSLHPWDEEVAVKWPPRLPASRRSE